MVSGDGHAGGVGAHRGPEVHGTSDGATAIAATVATVFDPARLTLARERSGLTRRALAESIGVTPAVLSRFERRLARPSASTLAHAAVTLGLPVTYFAAGRPTVRLGDAHFRSLHSTRAYERDQARAAMSHLAELVRIIEQVVRLPRLRLPEVTRIPEVAAREVRQAWGLPDGPVHHLVRLMESKGIVISMTGFGAGDRLNAFSCRPHGLDRPLVHLSRERGNVLRRRFSAAHELGHLVLHPRAVPGSAEHEQQADRFAAEFLGPAAELAAVLPTRLDLARLVEVQETWGLSVQALLRRSHDLEVIDDGTYRTGLVTLARLGWHRHDPVPCPSADHLAADQGGGDALQAGGTDDGRETGDREMGEAGGDGTVHAAPTDPGGRTDPAGPRRQAGAAARFTGEWPSLLRDAVQLASLQGLTEETFAAELHLPMTDVRELLSHVTEGRPQLRLVPRPPVDLP